MSLKRHTIASTTETDNDCSTLTAKTREQIQPFTRMHVAMRPKWHTSVLQQMLNCRHIRYSSSVMRGSTRQPQTAAAQEEVVLAGNAAMQPFPASVHCMPCTQPFQAATHTQQPCRQTNKGERNKRLNKHKQLPASSQSCRSTDNNQTCPLGTMN